MGLFDEENQAGGSTENTSKRSRRIIPPGVIVLLVVGIFAIVYFTLMGPEDDSPIAEDPTETAVPELEPESIPEEAAPPPLPEPITPEAEPEPPPAPPIGDARMVVVETNVGSVTIELFRDEAPKSVENFLTYASNGFYEGTVFHRVISGFMIQGGGMTADLGRKITGDPIENEATNGLKNTRGTLAMARTSEINSATSQFFINTVDNQALDHRGTNPSEFGYAVFGQVTEGMDVVDKIEAVQTGTQGPLQDVPTEPIVITSVRVVDP